MGVIRLVIFSIDFLFHRVRHEIVYWRFYLIYLAQGILLCSMALSLALFILNDESRVRYVPDFTNDGWLFHVLFYES